MVVGPGPWPGRLPPQIQVETSDGDSDGHSSRTGTPSKRNKGVRQIPQLWESTLRLPVSLQLFGSGSQASDASSHSGGGSGEGDPEDSAMDRSVQGRMGRATRRRKEAATLSDERRQRDAWIRDAQVAPQARRLVESGGGDRRQEKDDTAIRGFFRGSAALRERGHARGADTYRERLKVEKLQLRMSNPDERSCFGEA